MSSTPELFELPSNKTTDAKEGKEFEESAAIEVQTFLNYVAAGKQNEAEATLKKTSVLALGRGTVTDPANRTFKNITGFQYAVWALDWQMWKMIRKYLPFEAAQEQAKGFVEGSWVTEQGEQVNWKKLIEAYQTLIDNWNSWNWQKSNKHWVQEIGGAQGLCPIHVLQECNQSGRSFTPCPEFDADYQLDRCLKRITVSELGCEYAIMRVFSHLPAYKAKDVSGLQDFLKSNCLALTALLNTRIRQRAELMAELIKDYQLSPPKSFYIQSKLIEIQQAFEKTNKYEDETAQIKPCYTPRYQTPPKEIAAKEHELIELPAGKESPEKKRLSERYTLQAKQGIWQAAANGHDEGCLRLLKHHEINAFSEEGYTPLHLACANGYLKTVKLLLAQRKIKPLEKHRDAGLTALHYAMMSPPSLTPLILDCFPATHLEKVLGKHQETLLHMAARYNNLEGAKWLFVKGFTLLNASLDESRYRRTALHLAAAHGATEVVCYLLSQGANPQALNVAGETPLVEALYNLHEASAAAFCKQGVWLSHSEQEKLFIKASKGGRSAAIKALMTRVLEQEKIQLQEPVPSASSSSSSTSLASSTKRESRQFN